MCWITELFIYTTYIQGFIFSRSDLRNTITIHWITHKLLCISGNMLKASSLYTREGRLKSIISTWIQTWRFSIIDYSFSSLIGTSSDATWSLKLGNCSQGAERSNLRYSWANSIGSTTTRFTSSSYRHCGCEQALDWKLLCFNACGNLTANNYVYCTLLSTLKCMPET